MSIPDLCIYFVIGLVSVAYPILLQVIATLDEKYASIVIVDLFKREWEYRLFRILLVTVLCIIGIYAVINLSAALSDISWLIRITGYGLLLVTALLISTFLLFIRRILIYYTPAQITGYFIGKKEDQNFEYFNALADVLYFAMDKNLEGIGVLIHDYYYKAFADFRSANPDLPAEYPEPYYALVMNIVNRLAPAKNLKFRWLEHRTIGGVWLLGELKDTHISENTYNILWLMLVTAVRHQRDDMIMQWWSNAHQFFSMYLPAIQPDYQEVEEKQQVVNQATIDIRNTERERFLEFNYALGGLLCYKNRIECLKRIFAYTSSTPPNYVLLPVHMAEVFRVFFKFWDANHDHFAFIDHKYPFPDTEGTGSEGLVKIWICKYVAVLLLRQYSLVTYYTWMQPLRFPAVPAKKIERRMWISHLDYYEKYVKAQYENRDLLERLGWEKLKDDWLTENKKPHPVELVATVKKNAIAEEERVEREQEVDPEEVKKLKETITRVIEEAYAPYEHLFNKPLVEYENGTTIRGVRSLFDKGEFVKDKPSGFSNEHSITAAGVADQLHELIAGTFLTHKATRLNVNENTLFEAIGRLAPDPAQYVILNFGYNTGMYIDYHKVAGLERDNYKGIPLYNFSVARGVFRSIYVIKKDDLPYLLTVKPPATEITKNHLEGLGKHDLYFSVIDLFKNKKIRNEWLADPEVAPEQKTDIEKKVQVYVISLAIIRWKKAIPLTALKVVYPHDSEGPPVSFDTITQLDG